MLSEKYYRFVLSAVTLRSGSEPDFPSKHGGSGNYNPYLYI